MTSGEKNFLELLEKNGGEYNCSDNDLAFILGISVYSLAKYKKRLINMGYIKTQRRYTEGKVRCYYKLLKPYNPLEDVVKAVWD